MDGGVEGDRSAEPLERYGPDGLKADRLQRVGVSDDLVADTRGRVAVPPAAAGAWLAEPVM